MYSWVQIIKHEKLLVTFTITITTNFHQHDHRPEWMSCSEEFQGISFFFIIMKHRN